MSLELVRLVESLRRRVALLETMEATGSVARIEQQVLTSGQASITFSSIPATCSHLHLVYQARGEAVATSVALLMRMNADTAANYDYSLNQTANSANSATTSTAQTSVRIGILAAASAAAGLAGSGEVWIPNYALTSFQKGLTYGCFVRVGTAAADIIREDGGGDWRSTAAITSLTLLASSSNLASGSVFTLYGVT